MTRSRLLEFEKVTAHRLIVLEGDGTEDDPSREVVYWYDDESRFIGRRDPADPVGRPLVDALTGFQAGKRA